jgi:broad specificity phosphatase PhoE
VSRLVLVRHGRAAAGWDADPDPGLDDLGRAQAASMGAALAPEGPLAVVVSPLRRTRETAAALEHVWETEARVEPGVGEIVGPVDDIAERSAWLRRVAGGFWADQDPIPRSWRDAVLAALGALGHSTVVVTHFMAINVAVGAATDNDRLVCFRPDHCSRTVLECEGGRLRLVELGAEAPTRVL